MIIETRKVELTKTDIAYEGKDNDFKRNNEPRNHEKTSNRVRNEKGDVGYMYR